MVCSDLSRLQAAESRHGHRRGNAPAAVGKDFQARCNKIQARCNKIKARGTEIQIRRNEIQMTFPFMNPGFSMGYCRFRQAGTLDVPLIASPRGQAPGVAVTGQFAWRGPIRPQLLSEKLNHGSGHLARKCQFVRRGFRLERSSSRHGRRRSGQEVRGPKPCARTSLSSTGLRRRRSPSPFIPGSLPCALDEAARRPKR